MAEQQKLEVRRDGSRWFNGKPDPAEFSKWFKENVAMDPALEQHRERYIGGLVLIPAKEKSQVPNIGANGNIYFTEKEELTFTPYPKVDARIAYFWDLMAAKRDEWHGIVEPIPTTRPEGTGALAQMQQSLPEGFFITTVPVGEKYTHFLCCQVRVAVYAKPIGMERHPISREMEIIGRPLIEGRGTKMVPLLTGPRSSPWADPNSIMKAETGALGRALGFAGIFVVPGAGAASAEDMLEMMANPTTAAVDQQKEPEPPPVEKPKRANAPAKTGAEKAADEKQVLIENVRAIANELQTSHPDAYKAFTEWCRERKPPIANLGSLSVPALKGVQTKLTRLRDEAKAKKAELAASDPTPPEDPMPEDADGDGS